MGKLWALENKEKRKKEVQPNPCEENLLGSPERNQAKIPGDSQKPRILKICRKKSTGIRTAQGSMLIDTKNEGGCVPSATHGSEKG